MHSRMGDAFLFLNNFISSQCDENEEDTLSFS